MSDTLDTIEAAIEHGRTIGVDYDDTIKLGILLEMARSLEAIESNLRFINENLIQLRQ
jgi:hypothetical protein